MPTAAAVNFSARYIGETIPGITKVQYFYSIAAFDVQNQELAESLPGVSAYGPPVLDERHMILLQWQSVPGSYYYLIYKKEGSEPSAANPNDLFYKASATESGLTDVGYAAATRNSGLNPGIVPRTVGEGVGSINGIDGDINLLAGTNIQVSNVGQNITVRAYPAGANGDIQYNSSGNFAGSSSLRWTGTELSINGSVNLTASHHEYKINGVAIGSGGGTGPAGPPGPMPVFQIFAHNVPNANSTTPGNAYWTPAGGAGTGGDPFLVNVGIPVGIQGAAGGGPGAGVDSVNGITGAVTLAQGTNVTIVPSGNTLTINSTGGGGGVSSFNSLTGAVTISAGTNVTFTPSGNNIQINSSGGGGGAAPDFTQPGGVNTTGGALPPVPGPNAPLLQLASPALTSMILDGQDPANTPNIRIRATGGTFGAPAPVANLRDLGAIMFDGFDGTGYAIGAQIRATAAVTWTTLNRGSRLSFWVARTGFPNHQNAMSITGDGGLVLGAGSTGNGPETLTAPRGVFIGDGNLEIANGTIKIGGDDLFDILGFSAGLVARVAELEKEVVELEKKVK